MTPNYKYRLTDETRNFNGHLLHRIQAMMGWGDVEKYDLGGWVESVENLDIVGHCWIYDDAIACGNARVTKNAQLRNRAAARGHALITDDAKLIESACAHKLAILSGSTVVGGGLDISDAILSANITLRGQGRIDGQVIIA